MYKIYNESGLLLYVGKSNNPHNRITQHSINKKWWNEVSYVETAEVHGNTEASIYEIYTINTLKPKYNILDTHGGLITISLPDLVWTKLAINEILEITKVRRMNIRKKKSNKGESIERLQIRIRTIETNLNLDLPEHVRAKFTRQLDELKAQHDLLRKKYEKTKTDET